jgi:hypothetical protein
VLAQSAASGATVAANADGALEVFFLGIYGTVWHSRQDNHSPGGWTPEAIIPNAISTAVPSVAANADGRLELFLHGLDNTLTHVWENAPNGDWSAVWPITGGILTAASVVRDPAGRIHVFYGSIYGTVFTVVQDPHGAGGWSAPAMLTGVISTGPVGVAVNHDGRLEIIARSADGTPTHAWESAPGGSWSGPASMGGAVAAF